MTSRRGIVYLVGAGPGDPGLITARGRELLRGADVVVHDRLSPPELLAAARPRAEIIDAGKSAGDHHKQQSYINELLVERAQRGLTVVRLKGGDPFVFGRGFEEVEACRREGVPCVVIPGVTSAVAGPAAAGIPLTARELVRSVGLVTASTAGEDATPDVDFQALARMDTVVVLMGYRQLPSICASLREAGMDARTPAACIERATTPSQRTVRGTLATIADEAAAMSLRAPVVTVIGKVAAMGVEVGSTTTGLLVGKRVLVTRPSSRKAAAVARTLYGAGAVPIGCPLTRIVYSKRTAELDEAIRALPRYDWIAFTSAHGVRGFHCRLREQDLDSRAIAFCRVAAVGPGTDRELRRNGIVADVVADRGGARALADAILETAPCAPGRVLFPCGDRRRDALIASLARVGSVVDATVAYCTENADPPDNALAALDAGIDAILCYSPSAVERLAALPLDPGDAVIVCIGATTADAARRAGFDSIVTSERPTNEAMLAALERHFGGTEVPV